MKKASEAAKKQRDLKKFGKQVQVEKLKEREKEKRTMLEKVKALKRSILLTKDYANVKNDKVQIRLQRRKILTLNLKQPVRHREELSDQK